MKTLLSQVLSEEWKHFAPGIFYYIRKTKECSVYYREPQKTYCFMISDLLLYLVQVISKPLTSSMEDNKPEDD